VDPDLELLERWQGGDATAGEQLFSRHFVDLYRFFEHKLGGEADDLVQQTFIACVKARDAFRRQSSFRTYLFAIARNQLYTYLRRLPKAEHVDFEITSIAELVTSAGSKLGRAQQQLLLELHYWHELDAEALAEVFETTSGAIRVRLLRARRTLRSRLGQLDPSAAPTDGLVAALSRGEDETA
jgi:RNA polymerase sigma factor (sigma-70 family)